MSSGGAPLQRFPNCTGGNRTLVKIREHNFTCQPHFEDIDAEGQPKRNDLF
jgi:hypothetical protein